MTRDRLPERAGTRRSRAARAVLATGGVVGAVVFLAATLLWTWLGFVPSLEDRLPGVLADFADPGAWWPIALVVAAAVVASIAVVRRSGASTGRTVPVLAVLGGAALLIGIATYWPCSGEESPGWTALRRALDLFGGTLELPFGEVEGCPAHLPLGMQAARLFAMADLVLAASTAVALIFAERIDLLRARRARRVILFLGLDAHTAPLLRRRAGELTSRERIIVGGLSDDERDLARASGAPFLPVDPDDPAALRRLVTHQFGGRLVGLLAVSASPDTNLRALEAVMDAVGADERTARSDEIPERVLVRIDDPWHAEDWRRKHLGGLGEWLADAVSGHELAAAHALALLREEGGEQVVITGRTRFEVALQRELELLARLDAVSGIDPRVPVLADLAGSGADLDDVLTAGPRGLLVVPPDREPHEVSALAAAHPEWILLRQREGVSGITLPLVGGLREVGPVLDPPAGHGLDVWERAARVSHLRYLDGGARLVEGDPARGRWEELSTFSRESNLRTFTTLSASVAAAGRGWTLAALAQREEVALAPAELEAFAEAEHASWVRHHAEYGWRWGSARDERRLRHPSMQPWDRLDDAERDKDRSAVLGALEVLRALGFVPGPPSGVS